MKKLIFTFAIAIASSLSLHATPTKIESYTITTCIEEAMRLADRDLASGTITQSQYFGRVIFYQSLCQEN